ncbi:hypothetical protein D3C72_2212330 [compost metagenome]
MQLPIVSIHICCRRRAGTAADHRADPAGNDVGGQVANGLIEIGIASAYRILYTMTDVLADTGSQRGRTGTCASSQCTAAAQACYKCPACCM